MQEEHKKNVEDVECNGFQPNLMAKQLYQKIQRSSSFSRSKSPAVDNYLANSNIAKAR